MGLLDMKALSSTSNNVTGRQSLSRSKKWMPGKAAGAATVLADSKEQAFANSEQRVTLSKLH